MLVGEVYPLRVGVHEVRAEDVGEHAVVLVAVLLEQRHDVVAHDARESDQRADGMAADNDALSQQRRVGSHAFSHRSTGHHDAVGSVGQGANYRNLCPERKRWDEPEVVHFSL